MEHRKLVAYYRVSTQRQGKSGLGLEAQRHSIAEYLNGDALNLLAEFTEIESGKINERPELLKALSLCRLHKATLIIAKLDRLSRDAHFLLGLEKAGVDFIAADMPTANRLTVGIMALVAQQEREAISYRTKAALNAAKLRGVKLGKPTNLGNRKHGTMNSAIARSKSAKARAADIARLLNEIDVDKALSLQALAGELNSRNVPAPRGGRWRPVQVQRVLQIT
jgi:DNA invertase Pin-like site-specific DNA recombinase